MAKFEISCPYHGKLETIEVPDAYVESGFVGEVRCGGGDGDDSGIIKIEIARGKITKLERI